ncbi:MAG: PQQ-binding-like beta-propeller repeat protein, partial [Verrucomicrobia bacterium]|nr:PQQ-binding-like beta-propeller repeat protein [Verrucomicrobiota bacterium]
ARLPEFQTIPAATGAELTPSAGNPEPAAMRTWTVSHGDAGARRYSALTQINKSNVKELREAWTFRSGDGSGNIQCNPIVVDGVLYVPTVGHALVALDATKGTELWRFKVPPSGGGLSDVPARRGQVFWPGENGAAPRLVFACGNWVYAVDPKTGKPIEGFGQGGRTPLPTGGSGVGVISHGTYIVAGFSGDVYSFDLRTGEQLWRFHTIPREGEYGAETWQGSSKQGANPWGGLSLDEARGIVFVAVGAPRPDFLGVDRLGDNLYGNCVVALEAKTGKRLWHFQNVRHDIWDVDNPAPPSLVTITRDGRKVDAVVAVTKLGNMLLLDRVSGKPVFPFRLRRAPASTLPGEVTAPYQPDIELPEPLTYPEIKADQITERTPAAHEFVKKQVERGTMGWFEPPTEAKPMLYRSSRGGAEWTGGSIDVPTGRLYVTSNNVLSKATVYRLDELERDPSKPPTEGEKYYQQVCAPCHGPTRLGLGMVPPLVGLRHRMTDAEVIAQIKNGKGLMPPQPLPPNPPMTEQQQRDLLDFLMRRNQPLPKRAAPTADGRPAYFTVPYKFIEDDEGYPGVKPPWGLLNCVDLNTGKILWRVPLGEYPELKKRGVPPTGMENFGGPTVTAGGLVFVGGTRDELFRAFDKDTGAELWSAKLPLAGTAPPTIYEVGGRQFVVIAASGGGKIGGPTGDAWTAFALPEK